MAAKAAAAARTMPLLKLKLGGAGDEARLRQVRAACPAARLIADANEAWTPELLPSLMAVAAETGVELIEQPLPAGADAALAGPRPVPVCADESVHDRAGLAALAGRYDAVNIKLDKAGGLTEALALAARGPRARPQDHGGLHGGDLAVDGAGAARSPRVPTGSTSTGPCCSRATAIPALRYDGALVHPPEPQLWG